MERKLTTIVSLDVVGYSSLMERDEAGTFSRLKDLRKNIVEPAVSRHSGRIVKLTGDGALMDFTSVVGALQCAVDIQQEVGDDSLANVHQSAIQLRIGLHVDDIIVEDGDIYGDGVNVATRLESIAPPGGIVLSKQVHDHIGGNTSVRFAALGEQKVKNISRPIEAFRVENGELRSDDKVIRFDGFELDIARFELRAHGQRQAVEPLVFDLLVFLANNRDRTVTKQELFDEIWGGRIVSDAALSSQIKAARKVLGDDGTAQHTIRTVHGRGFRFIATVDDQVPAYPSAPALETLPVNLTEVATKPSVAVLPLGNLNRDPTEDYFSDGITEDITTALSRNRWLNVIARNPSFAFRDTAESHKAIGRHLDADYLVTGSVRKAGDRARISVQLVDAETEHNVWSERFDRNIVDIFDLQDEIAELVAARIETELGLTEQRKAERRPRKNLGAWDLYHLGAAEFYKFTLEGNLKCQDLMRRSLEIDPDFAAAHSRLAYAIVLSMVYFDVLPDVDLLDQALASAKRAIELDAQDAAAYFTIGRVYLARREYDHAIEALEHSLELNPSLAQTYCGLGDSLAYEGRLDEAIAQFEIAVHLSPHDPFRWGFYSYRALAHIFRSEFEEAATWAGKAVQVPNAQYWARAHLVSALGHLGDADRAAAALAELKRLKPEFSTDFAREHMFYLKQTNQIEIYIEGLKRAGLS